MAAPRSDGLIVGGDLLRQFAEVDPALHFFVQLGLNGCFFLQQGRQTDVIADRGVYRSRASRTAISASMELYSRCSRNENRGFFGLFSEGRGSFFGLGGGEGASSSRRSR